MRRWRLLAVLFALAGGRPTFAEPAARPKLVVFVVVDQLRAEYVDWYGAHWKAGLRRLYDGGAWFRSAAYPFLNTITCVGHATLGTGTYPHVHGMVLNAWYDRGSKSSVECTGDPAAPILAYGLAPGESPTFKGGESARTMLAPALADVMQEQLQPRPRVATFSWKARSAIGLGGHHPDVALWFDSGHWVTSRAFASAPVPWIDGFVRAHALAPLLDRPWARLLPAGDYRFDDDGVGEKAPAGWGASFPHPFQAGAEGLARWGVSPGPDQYLGDLARAAIAEMKLGQGGSTDFLAVSFSMLDIVGHAFGPRSHEVQDVLLRLDGVLGALLQALDDAVGPRAYVVAFSSDHGVAPIPEQARHEGAEAGRVRGEDLKNTVEGALVGAWGRGHYVAAVSTHEIYLQGGVRERLAAQPAVAASVLAALRALPGVAEAFSGTELALGPGAARTPIGRAAALSYFAGRSGDFLIAPKSGWVIGSYGTNHGSTNDYDQHVPVILYGAGVKPGKYDRAVSPADVAPTLARLVDVHLDRAEGKPLLEAIVAPSPLLVGPPAPLRKPRHRK
jgi:predicted AlkP superfamily pyrophosphatase or phosphodiesterase